MEELQKVLEKMPNTFTSNEFNAKARKCGISEVLLQNGTSVAFLKANCRSISKKVWAKITFASAIFQSPEDRESINIALKLKGNNEEEMITHLKSLGYKVLKPSWSEL